MIVMTPSEQDILRAALNQTTERFFKRRKSSLVMVDGSFKIDATGVLAVLAAWVGDLIRDAPEEMRDTLFMSFADIAVTVAGIKAEEEAQQETMQ